MIESFTPVFVCIDTMKLTLSTHCFFLSTRNSVAACWPPSSHRDSAPVWRHHSNSIRHVQQLSEHSHSASSWQPHDGGQRWCVHRAHKPAVTVLERQPNPVDSCWSFRAVQNHVDRPVSASQRGYGVSNFGLMTIIVASCRRFLRTRVDILCFPALDLTREQSLNSCLFFLQSPHGYTPLSIDTHPHTLCFTTSAHRSGQHRLLEFKLFTYPCTF